VKEETLMDLSTTYLGLKLPHPFMPGASPLADDLDNVRRLEDAGAAAIVMRSLFEEQIVREEIDTFIHTDLHGESFAEALCYFPSPDRFALGPEEYLEHITRIKAAVRLPVIASLNGTTQGGWLGYARLMEQAGADALELNVYSLASDFEEDGQALERRTLDMVRAVKQAVRVPVAVKLSPFYTSLAHFCRGLEQAGADGLVLFNRLLQPDIEPEEMVVSRHLHLSNRTELPLRLRWLALLSGRVRPSLAVTGGVHDGRDAIKALMAGAHAVQLVSALVQRGVGHLKRVHSEVAAWMAEHEYASLEQLRGSMNFTACPDPEVYERANYMLMLQGAGRRR
jgi:dihydroorotate dehydrogenase (fumarate)